MCRRERILGIARSVARSMGSAQFTSTATRASTRAYTGDVAMGPAMVTCTGSARAAHGTGFEAPVYPFLIRRETGTGLQYGATVTKVGSSACPSRAMSRARVERPTTEPCSAGPVPPALAIPTTALSPCNRIRVVVAATASAGPKGNLVERPPNVFGSALEMIRRPRGMRHIRWRYAWRPIAGYSTMSAPWDRSAGHTRSGPSAVAVPRRGQSAPVVPAKRRLIAPVRHAVCGARRAVSACPSACRKWSLVNEANAGKIRPGHTVSAPRHKRVRAGQGS